MTSQHRLAFFTSTIHRKVPALIIALHTSLMGKISHKNQTAIEIDVYVTSICCLCWIWEFWHASLHCNYIVDSSPSNIWIQETRKVCKCISNLAFCCISATISTLSFIAITSMSPQTDMVPWILPGKNSGSIVSIIAGTLSVMLTSVETEYWPQSMNRRRRSIPGATEATPLLGVETKK